MSVATCVASIGREGVLAFITAGVAGVSGNMCC